ncbi:uncharacterized protein LOC105689853 [Athalia rosae]|uniref:uncharacterized protein LOC105689853 n=1 Tax=Athalia rosae TaxID=37344 RepID=UPI0006263724|nr:uncharacterized protein LOC105689853 [Athalia rosae]
MNRVTGRKMKPALIIWCCLCITITNCDRNFITKRSVLGANPIEKPVAAQPEAVRSPDNRDPIKHDSDLASTQEQHKNHDKSSENTLNKSKENDVDNLTIKNSGNDKGVSNVKNSITTSTSTPVLPKLPSNTSIQSVNTGALLRGVSVFFGLSIIVMAYIIFRCMRLNKNRTQMVRKYGILAHRQDVEMRPLPLDDDEEDDTTVFDASEVVAVHNEQRRST